MKNISCECLEKPLSFDQYETVKNIGIDKTNGRFGEVEVKRCKKCGRLWLHYFVEYESFKNSGRYFMAPLTPETADALTPEKAIPYLRQLDWHLFGGSYFGKKGKSFGDIVVDGV